MKKHSFDPRKLMEETIEVMNGSIQEQRSDGKLNPLVGAILYKPDGTIDSSCRGELRDGDHAEYSLLERKNRSNKLDGSILFSSLEPCAPGSRHHPKLSCAERIVLARIKEVWVGIEDPDPLVDRKGIKYMQDNGIIVHMFDRDLQESILDANIEFIKQALERALAIHEDKKPINVVLSDLENGFSAVISDDLSAEAMAKYRNIAKITEEIASPEFSRRFIKQGLLKEENGQIIPTGFGMLLFGKEPRIVMPQAGLLATINYPDGTEEIENFEGPLVRIPDDLERWLANKLPNIVDRGSMRRKPVNSIPFEMIREAIVNALIHRDYSIRQAKCQLVVTENKIMVKSPGGPLPPIELKQLQMFTAPMLSRNPELHYVFAQMEMAEERGLGLISLKREAEKLELPLPKYSWEDPYLVLTIYQNASGVISDIESEILVSLNTDEREGLEFLFTQSLVTRKKYGERMGFDSRKAQRHLKRFTELGFLQKVGASSATAYEVKRS